MACPHLDYCGNCDQWLPVPHDCAPPVPEHADLIAEGTDYELVPV